MDKLKFAPKVALSLVNAKLLSGPTTVLLIVTDGGFLADKFKLGSAKSVRLRELLRTNDILLETHQAIGHVGRRDHIAHGSGCGSGKRQWVGIAWSACRDTISHDFDGERVDVVGDIGTRVVERDDGAFHQIREAQNVLRCFETDWKCVWTVVAILA